MGFRSLSLIHISLVGISGSGKSTLYDILAGFYEINKNQVFIDGKDLMELSITNLRELIQMVFQDTGIFAGTIRDNLKLFDEQITDKEIYNALEEVGLDVYKRQMVDGAELSKITKQEFAILELLLKHPKKVFSKEEIFEYAWEDSYMGETKTLDVHISHIRKKIKEVRCV